MRKMQEMADLVEALVQIGNKLQQQHLLVLLEMARPVKALMGPMYQEPSFLGIQLYAIQPEHHFGATIVQLLPVEVVVELVEQHLEPLAGLALRLQSLEVALPELEEARA